MHVVLIAVATLDGCITRHDDSGTGTWASAEDQAHFKRTIAGCDVRVFGANTYRADRASMRSALRTGIRRVVVTRNTAVLADDVVPGQLEFTAESPAALVERLRGDGHQRCALLGGGEVYGAFLGAGLVDEIQLSLEPLVFGSGVRLAGSHPIDQRFALTNVEHLSSSTLLLTYGRS